MEPILDVAFPPVPCRVCGEDALEVQLCRDHFEDYLDWKRLSGYEDSTCRVSEFVAEINPVVAETPGRHTTDAECIASGSNDRGCCLICGAYMDGSPCAACHKSIYHADGCPEIG